MKDIAIISGFSAFLLVLLDKWGVIEWLQVHGWEYVSRMANCEFCLSWWMCLAVSVVYAVYSNNALVAIYAIPATIICRFFITH